MGSINAGPKGMEWPGLQAALAGFLPLRPDMRTLVHGAEGFVYTPSSTYKYSYINQRSNFCIRFGIALVFAISLSLSALMWLTSAYDNAVLKFVSIRSDIDTVFENWRAPPTKPRLSVYIFNYTNAKEVMQGQDPIVQELGPYVFSEQMERKNIIFHPNGTVSFQETRHIKPEPTLSNGTFNDLIYVPNIPFLTILEVAATNDFAVQTVLSAIMRSVKVQVISNVTVHDFIWKMNDDFFSLLKTMKSLLGDEVRPFGFLAKRRGEHHDVVLMSTGNHDISKVGLITHWNGASSFGKWGNTKCDIMEASDGTQFPAQLVNQKKPLYLHAHSMCRRIQLRFNKTTLSKDGFPVNQYHVTPDLFDYTNNEENKCFNISGDYPRRGVFNTGPCQNGAPIYSSFPHFWQGDPSLTTDILGLKPNAEKHQSYFQIHEKLGITMKVKTRFQLNIMLRKPHFFPQFSNVTKDKLILPVAWLDYDSGDLKEEFVHSINSLVFLVNFIEIFLKVLLITVIIGCFIMVGIEIYKHWKK